MNKAFAWPPAPRSRRRLMAACACMCCSSGKSRAGQDPSSGPQNCVSTQPYIKCASAAASSDAHAFPTCRVSISNQRLRLSRIRHIFGLCHGGRDVDCPAIRVGACATRQIWRPLRFSNAADEGLLLLFVRFLACQARTLELGPFILRRRRPAAHKLSLCLKLPLHHCNLQRLFK